MPTARTITLRLTVEDPVPGVAYSLQDGKNAPVDPRIADAAPLSFDVPVQVSPGPKLSGPFVRREGPLRRFVYIAIGGQAGDAGSPWSRRAKIDVHDLPQDLLEAALAGAVPEARLPGRARDDGPNCGTVRPLDGWRLDPSGSG